MKQLIKLRPEWAGALMRLFGSKEAVLKVLHFGYVAKAQGWEARTEPVPIQGRASGVIRQVQLVVRAAEQLEAMGYRLTLDVIAVEGEDATGWFPCLILAHPQFTEEIPIVTWPSRRAHKGAIFAEDLRGDQRSLTCFYGGSTYLGLLMPLGDGTAHHDGSCTLMTYQGQPIVVLPSLAALTNEDPSSLQDAKEEGARRVFRYTEVVDNLCVMADILSRGQMDVLSAAPLIRDGVVVRQGQRILRDELYVQRAFHGLTTRTKEDFKRNWLLKAETAGMRALAGSDGLVAEATDVRKPGGGFMLLTNQHQDVWDAVVDYNDSHPHDMVDPVDAVLVPKDWAEEAVRAGMVEDLWELIGMRATCFRNPWMRVNTAVIVGINWRSPSLGVVAERVKSYFSDFDGDAEMLSLRLLPGKLALEADVLKLSRINALFFLAYKAAERDFTPVIPKDHGSEDAVEAFMSIHDAKTLMGATVVYWRLVANMSPGLRCIILDEVFAHLDLEAFKVAVGMPELTKEALMAAAGREWTISDLLSVIMAELTIGKAGGMKSTREQLDFLERAWRDPLGKLAELRAQESVVEEHKLEFGLALCYLSLLPLPFGQLREQAKPSRLVFTYSKWKDFSDEVLDDLIAEGLDGMITVTPDDRATARRLLRDGIGCGKPAYLSPAAVPVVYTEPAKGVTWARAWEPTVEGKRALDAQRIVVSQQMHITAVPALYVYRTICNGLGGEIAKRTRNTGSDEGKYYSSPFERLMVVVDGQKIVPNLRVVEDPKNKECYAIVACTPREDGSVNVHYVLAEGLPKQYQAPARSYVPDLYTVQYYCAQCGAEVHNGRPGWTCKEKHRGFTAKYWHYGPVGAIAYALFRQGDDYRTPIEDMTTSLEAKLRSRDQGRVETFRRTIIRFISETVRALAVPLGDGLLAYANAGLGHIFRDRFDVGVDPSVAASQADLHPAYWNSLTVEHHVPKLLNMAGYAISTTSTGAPDEVFYKAIGTTDVPELLDRTVPGLRYTAKKRWSIVASAIANAATLTSGGQQPLVSPEGANVFPDGFWRCTALYALPETEGDMVWFRKDALDGLTILHRSTETLMPGSLLFVEDGETFAGRSKLLGKANKIIPVKYYLNCAKDVVHTIHVCGRSEYRYYMGQECRVAMEPVTIEVETVLPVGPAFKTMTLCSQKGLIGIYTPEEFDWLADVNGLGEEVEAVMSPARCCAAKNATSTVFQAVLSQVAWLRNRNSRYLCGLEVPANCTMQMALDMLEAELRLDPSPDVQVKLAAVDAARAAGGDVAAAQFRLAFWPVTGQRAPKEDVLLSWQFYTIQPQYPQVLTKAPQLPRKGEDWRYHPVIERDGLLQANIPPDNSKTGIKLVARYAAPLVSLRCPSEFTALFDGYRVAAVTQILNGFLAFLRQEQVDVEDPLGGKLNLVRALHERGHIMQAQQLLDRLSLQYGHQLGRLHEVGGQLGLTVKGEGIPATVILAVVGEVTYFGLVSALDGSLPDAPVELRVLRESALTALVQQYVAEADHPHMTVMLVDSAAELMDAHGLVSFGEHPLVQAFHGRHKPVVLR